MKRPTVEYSKGEIGRVRVVEDFLPSPDKLTLLTDEQVAEVRRRIADPDRVLNDAFDLFAALGATDAQLDFPHLYASGKQGWASADAAGPRDDLGRAWKQILFNQFHDVLPGSAIESAYDDARDQLGEAVAIGKRIIARTHNVIARQVDIPLEEGTQPVLVFNPHPWEVTTEVEIQYGAQPSGVHVVDGDGNPTVAQPTQSVATTDDVSLTAVPANRPKLCWLIPIACPISGKTSTAAMLKRKIVEIA